MKGRIRLFKAQAFCDTFNQFSVEPSDHLDKEMVPGAK
jgi:hypothetical protein